MNAQPFYDSFKSMFTEGYYHAASLQQHIWKWALGLSVFLLVYWLFKRNKLAIQSLMLMGLTVMAAAIALFYALFHSKYLLEIRQHISLLKSFQIDRVYWLYPCIWFLIFGLIIYGMINIGSSKYTKYVAVMLSGVMVLMVARDLYYGNINYRKTVKEIVYGQETPVTLSNVSWKDFFAEDLFDEIKTYIGEEQESYRVASVGLYPSIALYNGFYCIDGYSNNYDVEYKHEFREIIAEELEKDEEIKQYFDGWGNRCYIFSTELGREYFFTKESGKTIKKLNIDTEKMKNMGCEYLFSAVPIDNAEELDLNLLNTFEKNEINHMIYCNCSEPPWGTN